MALVCVAIALALTIPALNLIPGRDAGIFLYIGQGILDGEVPYRDGFDQKPPLIHFTYALGLLVSSGAFWGPWLLELIAIALAGWLSVRFFEPLHGRLVAWAVTLIWMLSLANLMARGGYTELFTLPLQIGALMLYLRWREDRESRRWAFILGALAATAFLYRQNHLGIFAAVFLMTVLREGGWRRPGFLLRSTLWATLGGLTMCLPVAIYFTAHQAWGELFDATFYYNFLYVGIPQSDRWQAVIFGIERIPWSYAMWGVWAGLGLCVLARRLRIGGPRRALVDLALIAMPLEYYLSSASSKRYPHYFILCIPVLAILLAELLGVSRRLPERFAWRKQVGLALLIVLVAGALGSLNFNKLTRRYAIMNDPATDRDYRECIDFVRANTTPDDTVLVWGADPVILAAAERRSPTRFIYLYPLMAIGFHTDQVATEFVDAVCNNPPAMIVDSGHGWFMDLAAERRVPVALPDRVEARSLGSMSPNIEAFFEQLDREYRLSASFGEVDVFVRDE